MGKINQGPVTLQGNSCPKRATPPGGGTWYHLVGGQPLPLLVTLLVTTFGHNPPRHADRLKREIPNCPTRKLLLTFFQTMNCHKDGIGTDQFLQFYTQRQIHNFYSIILECVFKCRLWRTRWIGCYFWLIYTWPLFPTTKHNMCARVLCKLYLRLETPPKTRRTHE